MKPVKNAPVEVVSYLKAINSGGWIPTNDCTYYPSGDNPNKENNKAVVYHQLQTGEIVVKKRYEF